MTQISGQYFDYNDLKTFNTARNRVRVKYSTHSSQSLIIADVNISIIFQKFAHALFLSKETGKQRLIWISTITQSQSINRGYNKYIKVYFKHFWPHWGSSNPLEASRAGTWSVLGFLKLNFLGHKKEAEVKNILTVLLKTKSSEPNAGLQRMRGEADWQAGICLGKIERMKLGDKLQTQLSN